MRRLIIIVVLLFVFQTPVYAQEKPNIDHQIQILRLQLENASLRKQLISKQYVELRALERQLIEKISELSKQKEKQEKDQKKKIEDPKKEIDEEIRE